MKNILTKIGLFAVAMVTLTSCLDEDPLFDPDKVENVIEFFDIGLIASPGSVYPLYVSSFTAAAEVELKVIVSYSGAQENTQNINVKFKLDPAALEAYNDSEGTDYEVLPSNLYSIDAMEVTIPSGQRQVEKTIKLFTNNFDFSKNYAIPLTITESSFGVISGNFETAIYAVGAKNKYDGVYQVTGEFSDLTRPEFSGLYPYNVELRTITATTVGRWDSEFLGGYGYVFNTGGGLSYFGSYAAVFKLDDSNNVTAVTNYYGQPAANTRYAEIDPTGVNKYTTFSEDGKTLEVSYFMYQSGNKRLVFKEKYEYVRERG
ncbi:DUF1735 domain-containing protein [Algoriphagus aquimarinus]|uniref:DUF1735 domain-containing protein n=1 Tax=Algoriphagus aquimarinus TaxID=237018 RepID=A0A5C7AWE5_9BACT|nr:DUF1735 domain-containing protein [Algoriphagus aquimarinus]TXE12424.1 DUF1735 domain-containing protein [Algoriphagus aquimarinus]